MKYEDIIDLPHFEPKKHPRMSIYNRSAQFAPFAALTGYEDAIFETGRITDKKIELDEDTKYIIDLKLQDIEKRIKEKLDVKVTYFVKDKRKSGGRYIEYIGKLKRIDTHKEILIFDDNVKICVNDIIDISISKI